jgi:predicted PurR-regulated permease PerM
MSTKHNKVSDNAVGLDQESDNPTITSQIKKVSLSYQTTIATSLLILAIIAVISVLYFASPILIPITLAIYLNLLLSPIVIFFRRFRIPESASAGALVFGVLLILVVAINYLAEPAEKWLQQAPEALHSLQSKLLPITEPIEQIRDVSKKVDKLTNISDDEQVQQVAFQKPTILDQMTENLPGLLASVAIVVFLSYFLLASGDNFLRKLAELGENFSRRRRIVTITRDVQKDLSAYLLTISIINITLGGCVAATMHFLGVPNATLWGTLAALLNFVPYIGAFVMAGILTLVGIMTFNSLADAFLLPLIYAGFSILEGQLVTPSLIGRRLSLNTPIVFISLIFWGWIWGILGVLIAVPMLLTMKVFFDYIPSLKALSKLMER